MTRIELLEKAENWTQSSMQSPVSPLSGITDLAQASLPFRQDTSKPLLFHEMGLDDMITLAGQLH